MITFNDFDTLFIPLARKLGRFIANDESLGQQNCYWSIGGNNEWPRLAITRGWKTAVLYTGHMQCEWIDNINKAISIIVNEMY